MWHGMRRVHGVTIPLHHVSSEQQLLRHGRGSRVERGGVRLLQPVALSARVAADAARVRVQMRLQVIGEARAAMEHLAAVGVRAREVLAQVLLPPRLRATRRARRRGVRVGHVDGGEAAGGAARVDDLDELVGMV